MRWFLVNIANPVAPIAAALSTANDMFSLIETWGPMKRMWREYVHFLNMSIAIEKLLSLVYLSIHA